LNGASAVRVFPPHTSGERLFLAKLPNGILQRLHAGEPQSCGRGLEAPKLPGQRGDTFAVTVRPPRRPRKDGSRELCHEGLYHPAESGLEGTRDGGEIGGEAIAGDIGVGRGIDAYASAVVDVISAQEGGVEQGGAGGVRLGDKGIVDPGFSGLEGARGVGKSADSVLPVR
jgi:hypothetical protein